MNKVLHSAIFRDVRAVLFFASILAYPCAHATGPDKFQSAHELQIDEPQLSGWDVYLSGYAYHDRNTYTEKRINEINERAWGGGFGRTLRNDSGNDDSYYVMGIRDSNRRPQWMGGYAHQWIFDPLPHNEIGLGFSALLIKREDWFNGHPFPAVLPIASIGSRRVKLMTTYVPHLSTRKGKGNILLFFGRIEF